MEIKYILVILISIFTSFLFGQDKVVSYTYIRFDNEYQNSTYQYVGYDKSFVINKEEQTITFDVIPLIGSRVYSNNNIENQFSDYRINTSFKYNRNWYINTNLSFLNSKEWSPFFFDGLIRYSKGKYSTEFFIERESVGNPTTNQLRYISTTESLSLDYKIIKRLLIVNAISKSKITDGNIRVSHISRLIYTLNDISYIDFRLRRMTNSNWSPYYFSPDKINQYNFGYGLNKVYKGVTVNLYVGSGLQIIDNEDVIMSSYDLKLSKVFNNKYYIEVSNSSKNFDTYIYNTINVKFTILIK